MLQDRLLDRMMDEIDRNASAIAALSLQVQAEHFERQRWDTRLHNRLKCLETMTKAGKEKADKKPPELSTWIATHWLKIALLLGLLAANVGAERSLKILSLLR